MTESSRDFATSAQKFIRNPLGIIGLFIVFVYAMAGIVLTVADTTAEDERLPLIYFLVLFPVLVLGVFAWLVSKHGNKLFAPEDFRDEENYVKALTASASLASAASTKGDSKLTRSEISEVVTTVLEVTGSPTGPQTGSRNNVLWVDDRPENNVIERQAFEAFGLNFTLVLSTDEALRTLKSRSFTAVISDMGRREGPREGYVLLDAIRASDNKIPFFIYAGSNDPEHKREADAHGAQGSTNRAQELFQMVMRAVLTS